VQRLRARLPWLQPQAERGREVVGKPEIIGYQSDPLNWSAPRLPDMTFDLDGFWIDGPTGVRELVKDVDGFMRYHGMKRVYKPREFRADRIGNGNYGLYCKTCGIYAETGLLPHDAAELHAENHRHYSASWPLDLVA
jgi:hypothetical protein